VCEIPHNSSDGTQWTEEEEGVFVRVRQGVKSGCIKEARRAKTSFNLSGIWI
jgi:hypothetical protein